MTTVGFIGSGNLGGTVARLAVAAGYDVVLSNSCGPQTLKDLVEALGPGYRACGEGVQQRHLLAPRLVGAPGRSALPIAGDDPAAKATVAEFLDTIGYDTADAGPLGSGGRRFQY